MGKRKLLRGIWILALLMHICFPAKGTEIAHPCPKSDKIIGVLFNQVFVDWKMKDMEAITKMESFKGTHPFAQFVALNKRKLGACKKFDIVKKKYDDIGSGRLFGFYTINTEFAKVKPFSAYVVTTSANDGKTWTLEKINLDVSHLED